ncbi:hypothetical protein FB451DRAFT_1565458 [Mycena latifolia]|nr:hypothetical protein FB451DRAFT_1565458 [Mycena latifolia]
MPRPQTSTAARWNTIKNSLTSIATLLEELNDVFGTPFVQAISNTAASLIAAVQNVKRNQDTCVKLIENTQGILHAIIELHIRSEPPGNLAPTTLKSIGRFTETLHKIHSFVEAQQDGNKIKHFFRQGEMNVLLKDCWTGLQDASEVFKIEAGVTLIESITEMQSKTQNMHNELMELIAALSDETSSDKASSLYYRTNESHDSSNSFAMLPGKPKIFHGRGPELEHLINTLAQSSARVAILGAGGMGKTSLSRAVLHHPDITARYANRFFVACDSAATSTELATLIGSHLGLKPGKALNASIVQYFSRISNCLLILDNLDTSWEPTESRAGVEELLSLLTDLPHLALIITMRGTERPTKVRWTRPFLAPLKPLTNDAAQQTFLDITDNFHDSTEVERILALTDNMPLAVNLMAHLVDIEGCLNVLSRWETEKTAMLSESDRRDRMANLDMSIALSLSSPRMQAAPGAKDLLSLLSILPDGLSDVELLQSNLSIPQILACKSALLSTALAYRDGNDRLKALVPIREYVGRAYPPSSSITGPLQKYLQDLVDVYIRYRGCISGKSTTAQIVRNVGNLENILLLGLHLDNPDIQDAIYCALSLDQFKRAAGLGRTSVMDQIPRILNELSSPRLEVHFITEVFLTWTDGKDIEAGHLVAQAQQHFHNLNDVKLEARFYNLVGDYYQYHNNIPDAMRFHETALSLARSSGDTHQECTALVQIALINFRRSDYSAAQVRAHEAEKLAKLSGNLYHEARALHVEGTCLYSLGRYQQSFQSFRKGRELLNLCGLSHGLLDRALMSNEAQVHLLKSEYSESRSLRTTIAQQAAAEPGTYSHASSLFNIAEIDVIVGASENEVHQNIAIAKTIFTDMKYPLGLTSCDKILADLDLRERRFDSAKTLLVECFTSARGKNDEAALYCLERLGDSSLWNSSDVGWTIPWTIVFLGFGLKAKAKLVINKALRCLGDMFVTQDDPVTARHLYVVALEGFTAMDVHRSRADCMLRLGDISTENGDLEPAVKFWEAARRLYERSSQLESVARIDTRLAATAKSLEHIKTKSDVNVRGLIPE